MPWEWPVGAMCAFALAVVTTPAGVSGAVLLLPVQLGVLGTPSPAVTPTNFLYNVAATPGALLRFGHEDRLQVSLTLLLIAGTLPGVVAGAVIRVELLSSAHAFMWVVASVLLPLGLWLFTGSARTPARRPHVGRRGAALMALLALAVGCAGGIYGIGGGALLAPILLALGFSAYDVAPATIAVTLLTSLAGIASYEVLQLSHSAAVAPDWALGAWLGAGGFCGSYVGARLQRRLPEAGIRRILGLVACVVAVRFGQQAAEHRAAHATAAVLA